MTGLRVFTINTYASLSYLALLHYYPSITENLLKKALAFAKAHIHLSDDDKAIIQHARKSLLFNDKQTWIKRDSGPFDVTMEANDGAELCELVANYLLYELSKLYGKKDIGLYIDTTDWRFLRI